MRGARTHSFLERRFLFSCLKIHNTFFKSILHNMFVTSYEEESRNLFHPITNLIN